MLHAAILVFSSFLNVAQAAPVTCFDGRPDVKRKARNGDTHLIYNVEARRNQRIQFDVRAKKKVTINSCAGEKTVAIPRAGKDIALKRQNGALSSDGSTVTLALSRCSDVRAGGITTVKLIKDRVVKKCKIKIKPAKPALKKIPAKVKRTPEPRVIYVKTKSAIRDALNPFIGPCKARTIQQNE